MAKYASGANIPLVGIQPSASPVAINVLPAAGQPTRGSELQQIAESLAPFNQGLMAFGTAMVRQDAERAQQMGENLDFGGLTGGLDKIDPALRGEELNKRFKSTIEASGWSDVTNPYFQIAAQQNYGRALGLEYRKSLYAMKEQLTDPEHPMPYAEASAKAMESVLGNSLEGNYYGYSGFRDVATKTDQEMQMRFSEERTQRMETLGGMRAQEAMGKAIEAGDPVLLNTIWGDYQRTSTDPAKNRITFTTAARSALHAAPNSESLDNSFELLSGMQFGTSTVHDNIALYADLVQHREQAESALYRKMLQQSNMGDLAKKKADEQMNEAGVNATILHEVTSGRLTTDDAVNAFAKKQVDELSKRFGWTPATQDKMLADIVDDTTKAMSSAFQTDRQQESRNDTEIKNRLMPQVMSGEMTQKDIMESGLSADSQVTMLELSSKFTNRTLAAKTSALDTAVTTGANVYSNMLSDLYPAADGRGTSIQGIIHANELAKNDRVQLGEQVDAFVRGDVKDRSGKTYAAYQAISPEEAALAVKGFAEDAYTIILNKSVAKMEVDLKAGKVFQNGRMVAREDDAKVVAAWLSQENAKAQLALDVQSGAASEGPAVEQAMRPVYADLAVIADDVDHGWTGSTELTSLEYRLAQLFYESKDSILRNGTDRIVTNDSRLRTYTGVAPLFESMGWLTDGYDTKMTLPEITERYGKVRRASGLSLVEIKADTDRNGISVEGVTIPRGLKERQSAAFSQLMIQNTDELRNDEDVGSVLAILGLTESERPRFIQVQTALLRMHKAGYDRIADKFTFGSYGRPDVDTARGIYQRSLEQHQQRQNNTQ